MILYPNTMYRIVSFYPTGSIGGIRVPAGSPIPTINFNASIITPYLEFPVDMPIFPTVTLDPFVRYGPNLLASKLIHHFRQTSDLLC